MSVEVPKSSAVALRDALAERGGTLAEVLLTDAELSDDGLAPGPSQLAAAGPRAAGNQAQYELLLEIIREGSLLHYGEPRVVAPTDPDLALLLGDQLYALGLIGLAALGDLDAVGELGDTISLLAQAQAAGDPELAEAVWRRGRLGDRLGCQRAAAPRQGDGPRGGPRRYGSDAGGGAAHAQHGARLVTLVSMLTIPFTTRSMDQYPPGRGRRGR